MVDEAVLRRFSTQYEVRGEQRPGDLHPHFTGEGTGRGRGRGIRIHTLWWTYWTEILCLLRFMQIGLPTQPQRHAILSGYIRRHHTEMGEQGVAKELMEDMPGEGDLE